MRRGGSAATAAPVGSLLGLLSATLPDRIERALRAHRTADDPVAALEAARVLREHAEQLERTSIDDVRAAGLPWSRIGALYGLTRQGAQQRFKKGAPGPAGPSA